MVSTPGAFPVSIPVIPMALISEFTLLHTPPGVASRNATVKLRHTSAESGAIAEGTGLTVTTVVAIQAPVLSV
jgi:hypothetical protein